MEDISNAVAMHSHGKIIEELGGATRVAELLSAEIGQTITSWRAHKWKKNGVAPEFRVPVARILIRHDIPIPEKFFPDGLVLAETQATCLEAIG